MSDTFRISGRDEGMTLRERFRRTMQFQTVDRIPNFEFGYWDQTLPNWREQGMPDWVKTEGDAYNYFGIENWGCAGPNLSLNPPFDGQILEETDDYVIGTDGDRATYQSQKTGIRTIPHYLEYGLKDRDDWKLFKERLQPGPEGRYPDNWDELAAEYNKRDYPLAVPVSSMIGTPRNWIGFQNIAYMCYDDPDLLDEIVETMCVVVETTLPRALQDVEFDFGAGWEDICFNSGPIISPTHYRRFVLPRYRRIADLLKKHGVHLIWTDCDGNLTPIADILLEGGYNILFPAEVHGGTDPVRLRQKYGTQLLCQGGVDKMPLRGTFKDIENELLRLLPMVEEGGFIPHVDHRVPADVPFENYKFYMKLKREVLKAGKKEPMYDASA